VSCSFGELWAFGSRVYEFGIDVQTGHSLVDEPAQMPGGSRVLSGRLPRLERAALLTRGGASRLEALVFAAVALGFALAVYGAHIVRGGFYLDDWAFAAEAELFEGRGGVVGLADRLLTDSEIQMSAGGRPVAALYYASTHGLFGGRVELHLALAVVLAALVSVLFFLVLRTLAVERIHAAAMALLLLVFPAADATRFWLAASVSLVSLSFLLGGLLLALKGLRERGGRAVVLHAAAVACYALSLLAYEVAIVAIASFVLVYRLRVPWRAAAARWFADLAAVGAVALYVRATTAKDLSTVGEQIDRARTIQGHARTLLGSLGLQDGVRRLPVAATAAALLLAALVWLLLSPPDPVRARIGRWLLVALAGIAIVGVGYAPLVFAAEDYYVPLALGIGNRVNIGAAFGFVLLIYALAVLMALMAVRVLERFKPLRYAAGMAAAGAVAAAALVGLLWLSAVNDDRRAYAEAYALEQQTLDVLRRLPAPPIGTTVFAFGLPGEIRPGIPAFSRHWDLTGAVRILWKDGTLKGIPGAAVARTKPGNRGHAWGIACAAGGVRPLARGWSVSDEAAYGRALFVDVPKGRSTLIEHQSQCRRETALIEGYID
jgi:hypothetical protein